MPPAGRLRCRRLTTRGRRSAAGRSGVSRRRCVMIGFLVACILALFIALHRAPDASASAGACSRCCRSPAIIYSAITLGGPHQATIGMRMMGVRAWTPTTGGPFDRLTAAVHALLFYVAVTTLHPVGWSTSLLGLFRARTGGSATTFSPASCSAARRLSACGAGMCLRPSGAVLSFTAAVRFAPTAAAAEKARDESAPRHAAVLPDGAIPLPLSAGQGGAEGVHAYRRQARPGAERHPDPRRLPPLADHRLSARLRGLPRLRLGPRAWSTSSSPPATCAGSCAEPRPRRRDAAPNRPSSEQYSLFRRYLDSRHADGGMADMTVLDYAMMVEDSHVETRIVEYRRRGPDTASTAAATATLIAVLPHRRARRRPLDGLLVLRSRRGPTAASAPS